MCRVENGKYTSLDWQLGSTDFWELGATGSCVVSDKVA